MPKGEVICEGCGQYESECKCELNDRYPLTKPDDRLLTDEEILLLINQTGWSIKRAKSLNLVSNYKTVAKAQDEKTASIFRDRLIRQEKHFRQILKKQEDKDGRS